MARKLIAPTDAPRTVARSAAGMGVAAAVSRAFGAVRVLVIAAVLGTTNLGNAFGGSNSTSNVLFELLAAGALSAVLVPTFVGMLDRGDQPEAEELAGELLGSATVILGLVSIVGVALSPWIAGLLTSAVRDPHVAAQQRHLSTILLWFFIPQIVLYGLGSITTAVLTAQRRFLVPAIAPIGNTVVMVSFLIAFRVVAGPNPGLELTGLEQVLLGLGGTLGVVAFVAAPTIALARTGFRLSPKLSRRNERLKRMLALSGWAGLQQAFTALLLAAAIIVGGGVEGGVVAYQAGWVFFLAPYGIIAQPIHTTILPELVGEVERGDMAAFTSSVRWALDSMTMLLVPLTALALALAVPAMRVLAFGAASSRTGVSLLAAALGSLVLGLLPYGAFFLLARAWYVLGDSRRPAIAGGIAAVIGAGLMALAGAVTDHASTVFALGAAHTVSFVIASGMLVVALRSRVGHWILPPVLPRVLAICVPVVLGVWLVERAWAPMGRWSSALARGVLAPLAVAVHFGIVRLSGTTVTPRVPITGELA